MFGFFKKKSKKEVNELKAILNGTTIPMEEVPDETFAEKIMGDGIAFQPENDQVVVSPGKGVAISASEGMKHACGVQLDCGISVLIHIGLDTVEMDGDGFELLVQNGDQVEAGTPLVQFDAEKIKERGLSDLTMMVIIDAGIVTDFNFVVNQKVTKAESVVVTF